MQHFKGIYLISKPHAVNYKSLEYMLASGFVKKFQLRLKDISQKEFANEAMKCKELCQRYGIIFIVNDNFEIFVKSSADGLHIGFDDGASNCTNIAKILEVMPTNTTLGISCYDNIEMAIEASKIGVDYVSFGAFFETKTKVTKAKPNPQIILDYHNYFVDNLHLNKADVCVIGGVNNSNINILRDKGIDYACIISYLWDAENDSQELLLRMNSLVK
jgi:thiamine-phosphate pyrophosphorylase